MFQGNGEGNRPAFEKQLERAVRHSSPPPGGGGILWSLLKYILIEMGSTKGFFFFKYLYASSYKKFIKKYTYP